MYGLPLVLTAVLAFEPPAQAADADADSITQIRAALDRVGSEEPAVTLEALEGELAKVVENPELAVDESIQETLLEARLSLAWLHLANEDKEAAAAAMDEALRSARGRKLPAGRFGPAVLELHDERKAALNDAGMAAIAVDCKVPCTVVINEHLADNPAAGLGLGRYRVWVGASEGDDPAWTYSEVELDEAGETQSLVFVGPESKPAPSIPVDVPSEKKKKSDRMLPRWAEILGMGVGVGLIAGGAVFMAYHGKCRGGGDPATCPFVYNNLPQGIGMLAGGGAVFLTFGALLTVDEVRVGRAKGKQAMLTWTMRF